MQSKIIDVNENFIYYNAQLTGERRSDPSDPITLIESNYNDISTTPILEKIEDYNLSIVRFKIPAPGYIFNWRPFDISSNNYTDPFYYVNMVFGDSNASDALDYKSYTITSPYNILNDIYPINTFDQFCEMINASLLASFTALKILEPTITATTAPYMVFNVDTQKFEMKGEIAWITGANIATIRFSTSLYERIPTLPASYAYTLTANNDWQIIIRNTGDNVNASGSLIKPSGQAPGSYFVLSQQSKSLSAMFDAEGLYLTTTMPVKAESLPQSTTSGGQASNNFIRVITDFQIDYASGDANEPYLQNYITYSLQNTNTRKIQFIGQGSLTNIEFRVFWYDRYGELFPIYIGDGQTMSVKFQFTKRKEIKYQKI